MYYSMYAKFPEKVTFATCTYQGLRSISISNNFAYALNELSLVGLRKYFRCVAVSAKRVLLIFIPGEKFTSLNRICEREN